MVFVICCLALTYAVAVSGADNFAKFNQPAALGAYKDINDMAAADPVQVLGKTWKKFVYPDDYELPDKPALGAYQDIINNVKDPETVLGVRTFETKCESGKSHR